MSTPNNEQQILARLLNLETLQATRETLQATRETLQATREAATNTAFEALRKENVHLKREIVDLKKSLQRMEYRDEKAEDENSRLREEIGTLSDRMKNLEAENAGLKEDVETVSGRTEEFRHVARQLSGLHGVLCRSLVDRQNIPDLYQKVDDLGSRLDDIDEHKTNSLEHKTSSLEQTRDDYEQSITRACLGQPTGGLVTGQAVKMDCVTWVGEAGILDKTTGCLVSKRSGTHFVCVILSQIGGGEINVRMKWEGASIGRYVVGTVRGGDVQTGVTVTSMKKGKNYWFEATRVKGEAKIEWCLVYCWLVSP